MAVAELTNMDETESHRAFSTIVPAARYVSDLRVLPLVANV